MPFEYSLTQRMCCHAVDSPPLKVVPPDCPLENNRSPGPNIAAIPGPPLLPTVAFLQFPLPKHLHMENSLDTAWGNISWSLYRRGRWHHSHWRRIGVMEAEWKLGIRHRFVVFVGCWERVSFMTGLLFTSERLQSMLPRFIVDCL